MADPTIVGLVYSCFKNMIEADADGFRPFVEDNFLEVEWVASSIGTLEFVPTENVFEWLLAPPQEPSWIFVGRLLRPETDNGILENPAALKVIYETVFGGFRPIWEQTQRLSSTVR